MTDSSKSQRIKKVGSTSWALLGIMALTIVVAIGLGKVSGIVVPLIIAIILGTLLEPIQLFLEKRHFSPSLASVLSLLIALLAASGVTFIVLRGFVQQLPQIITQLQEGWASFMIWLRSLDLDPIILEKVREAAQNLIPKLSQGFVGALSGTFAGAITFALSAFFAIFFLFYILRDSRKFPAWFARVADLNAEVVEEVTAIARDSLQGYFKGTAITALVTAPFFMLPLIVLKIPLLIPMFVMYFVLSFIPYVGAWITGFFAILIAFGTGGSTAALIVTLGLLISNGPIQNVALSWTLGNSLSIHPMLVLIATIVGGSIAGMLGMVLAPPLTAAVIKSLKFLRSRRNLTRQKEPQ